MKTRTVGTVSSISAAALAAVGLTLAAPSPPEADATPACTAFASTPTLVEGVVGANGGATCTASNTGLFRVDVILFRNGAEVARAVNVCNGEQQCGARPEIVDDLGPQEWCVQSIAAYTGNVNQGSSSRTQRVCEAAAF